MTDEERKAQYEADFKDFLSEKKANRTKEAEQRRKVMEAPKVYERRQSTDGVSSFDVWPATEGNTVS